MASSSNNKLAAFTEEFVEAILYEGGLWEDFTNRNKMNYVGVNIRKHVLKLPLDMTLSVLMDRVKHLGQEVGLNMDCDFDVDFKRPGRRLNYPKNVDWFAVSVELATVDGNNHETLGLSDSFKDYVRTQHGLGKPIELYLHIPPLLT